MCHHTNSAAKIRILLRTAKEIGGKIAKRRKFPAFWSKTNSATDALSHRPSNLCTWCNGTPVLLLFSILYFFICRFVVTIAITTLYTAVYGVTTNGTVSTHYVFCSQPAGAREKFRGAREKFRGAREIYCGARRFFRGARVMAGVVVTLHFVVTP